MLFYFFLFYSSFPQPNFYLLYPEYCAENTTLHYPKQELCRAAPLMGAHLNQTNEKIDPVGGIIILPYCRSRIFASCDTLPFQVDFSSATQDWNFLGRPSVAR